MLYTKANFDKKIEARRIENAKNGMPAEAAPTATIQQQLLTPTREDAFKPGFSMYYGEMARDVMTGDEWNEYVAVADTLAGMSPTNEIDAKAIMAAR